MFCFRKCPIGFYSTSEGLGVHTLAYSPKGTYPDVLTTCSDCCITVLRLLGLVLTAMDFGTRNPTIWVLGPAGFQLWSYFWHGFVFQGETGKSSTPGLPGFPRNGPFKAWVLKDKVKACRH